MLMLKAGAYGHGLCETALATQDIVDAFGVATVEEGLSLKAVGIEKDIFTLICSAEEIYPAIKQGLVISLSNFVQLSRIEGLLESGKLLASEVRLHIALDSGMHRLGFLNEQLDELLYRLKKCGVQIEGVYSHLRVRSYRQIYSFESMCVKVREAYPNATRHLASSHSLASPRLRYDMVRVGISAYEGAMTVASEVVAARCVHKGEFVSYGSYKLKKDTNTAVVFGGYADGVYRERPSSVYIRGKKCKILGNVCMDMSVVDCGDFLPEIGEKVVLAAPEYISDIAKERKSIEYTVMTCWHGRVEKIYDKGRGEKSCEGGDSHDERRG